MREQPFFVCLALTGFKTLSGLIDEIKAKS